MITIESAVTAEPAAATEPAVTAEPAAATEPAVTVEPAAPIEPAVMVEPAAAAEPVAPAAPAAAAEPVEPAAAPVRALSDAGIEVLVETSDPSASPEAVSVPIEVSLPRAASSDSLDVPVELTDAASSPVAATAASITDAGVDLSNLPSSPLSAAVAAAGSPAVTPPSARTGPRWQPSRALFFAVAVLAVVLVIVLLVTRSRRPVAPVGAPPMTSSEPAGGATAPARTEASAPTMPEATEATDDDDEPADPMARRSSGDPEPEERKPRGRARASATPKEPAGKEPAGKEPAAGSDEPAAAPAGTGTVNVYSTPPATVYIDGRRIGTTPKQVNLPAGPHTVVVEDPELGRQSVQVDVQPKKQHSVNLTLD